MTANLITVSPSPSLFSHPACPSWSLLWVKKFLQLITVWPSSLFSNLPQTTFPYHQFHRPPDILVRLHIIWIFNLILNWTLKLIYSLITMTIFLKYPSQPLAHSICPYQFNFSYTLIFPNYTILSILITLPLKLHYINYKLTYILEVSIFCLGHCSILD